MNEVLDPANTVVAQPLAQRDVFTQAAHRSGAGPASRVPAWVNQQVTLGAQHLARSGDELAVAAWILPKHPPAEFHSTKATLDIGPRRISHGFWGFPKQRRGIGQHSIVSTAPQERGNRNATGLRAY